MNDRKILFLACLLAITVFGLGKQSAFAQCEKTNGDTEPGNYQESDPTDPCSGKIYPIASNHSSKPPVILAAAARQTSENAALLTHTPIDLTSRPLNYVGWNCKNCQIAKGWTGDKVALTTRRRHL